MADQMEPQENQSHTDQPLSAGNQAGYTQPEYYTPPAHHFVAPAESFGPFGPLPDYPTSAAAPEQQVFPAPVEATPVPYPPAQPGTSPYAVTPQPVSFSSPGSPTAAAFLPQSMALLPPLPTRTPRLLLFPLTRKAPALLQFFGMLLYILLVAIGIMICTLLLFRAAFIDNSVYSTADGGTNVLSVVLTCVIALVLVPAASLFSGILFGSWRGVIVSLLSTGGGVVITYITDPRLGVLDSSQGRILYLSLPVTALIVGLIYDQRTKASWWKSLFTIVLGTAVPVISLLALIFISDVAPDTLSTLAANAHTTPQQYLVTAAINFAWIALLSISILSVLFASIEGFIHSILAHNSKHTA